MPMGPDNKFQVTSYKLYASYSGTSWNTECVRFQIVGRLQQSRSSVCDNAFRAADVQRKPRRKW